MPVALLAVGNAAGQLAAIIGTPMRGQCGFLVHSAEGWQFVIITLIGPSAGVTILIQTNRAKMQLRVLGIPDAFLVYGLREASIALMLDGKIKIDVKPRFSGGE